MSITAEASSLIANRAVYEGAMCVQTDAGILAHEMIVATQDTMRTWSKDGSDPADVSRRWVARALAEVGAEVDETLVSECISYVLERYAARRASRKAERDAADAKERTARNAATPRQLSYIRSLTGHPEVLSMLRAGLSKREASQLIDEIKAGEIG